MFSNFFYGGNIFGPMASLNTSLNVLKISRHLVEINKEM